MMQIMPESAGKLLCIRASGQLSQDDYSKVLEPAIEERLAEHDRLRVMILLDASFAGWNLKSAWANTCLDMRFRRSFEKLAMLGAPKWEEWCVRLAALFMKGEFRTYRREEVDEALAWLKAR